MKITVFQEDFAKALAIVGRSVSTRPTLPILGNILLSTEEKQLKISATNLETGINLWIGAKIKEAGAITLPAKILTEFISSLPAGEIEIESEGLILKIQSGSYSAVLNGISSQEFPNIPQKEKDKPLLNLEPKAFAQAIQEVVFAAALDEGRPVLTGVLTDLSEKNLVLVATDGYRLSYKTHQLKETNGQNVKVVIPSRALSEIAHIISDLNLQKEVLEVYLTPAQNQILFHIGNLDLVARLIEGQFPAWQKIVPQNSSTKAFLDRGDLMSAVKLASIFARDGAGIVRLLFDPEKGLTVAAATREVGENQSQVETKIEGEKVEVAFNGRYLLEVLGNIKGEKIVFETMGSLSPGVIKFLENNNFLHLIMPVKLNG